MNNQPERPSFGQVLYKIFIKNFPLRILAFLGAVAITILLYTI